MGKALASYLSIGVGPNEIFKPVWGPSAGINKHVSICESPGWLCFDMLIDLNDGILTGFPFSHGSAEFCFWR